MHLKDRVSGFVEFGFIVLVEAVDLSDCFSLEHTLLSLDKLELFGDQTHESHPDVVQQRPSLGAVN